MAAGQRYLFGSGLKRWIPWLLLAPGLFFYFLIGVGPSMATAIYSLTDATGIRGLPINWVGFDNYDEFLLEGARGRQNLDVIQRTLVFMFLVTTIQFPWGPLLGRCGGLSVRSTLPCVPLSLQLLKKSE